MVDTDWPRSGSDPSSDIVGALFVPAINDYLRRDLKFPYPSPYRVQGGISEWPIQFEEFGASVIDDLGQVMAQNPNLKVLINSGYFDLATPLSTVEYSVSQIPGRARLKSRIKIEKYFGGHMMYINPEAAVGMRKNIVEFIHNQSQSQILRDHRKSIP
jgi:carboxypeptidase C (cathepsin A)